MQYDLKAALNAISDVVQNRPLPLREFDQIYMKVGDMVEQAFFIADKFQNLDVVFIGDGDSIALSVIHLWKCKVFPNAPRRIHLLDFDERIVKAVTRFADKYRYQEHVEAELYNVAEPLPWHILAKADAFYTNPSRRSASSRYRCRPLCSADFGLCPTFAGLHFTEIIR
jgi:N4-bis(aminopropyl)spermidine synthase